MDINDLFKLSVGVGIGIIVFIAIGVVLVIIGLCTSRRRTRDVEREIQRRREAVVRRYEEEQTQWRQRRLQDVVLVLVDRGEAFEGVPLAFQLPGHREVNARRNVRLAHRVAIPVERELDPEVVDIVSKPLEELLAAGRPPDAEPAPDIMHLLLEGHADRAIYSDDSLSIDESDYDTYFHPASPESATTSRDAVSALLNTEEREMKSCLNANGQDLAAGNTIITAAAAATTIPADTLGGCPPPAQRAGRERAVSTGDVVILNGTSLFADGQRPSVDNPREALKEEVIIRKLHSGLRQRKTAEEVFGLGASYSANPENEALGGRRQRRRRSSSPTHEGSSMIQLILGSGSNLDETIEFADGNADMGRSGASVHGTQPSLAVPPRKRLMNRSHRALNSSPVKNTTNNEDDISFGNTSSK